MGRPKNGIKGEHFSRCSKTDSMNTPATGDLFNIKGQQSQQNSRWINPLVPAYLCCHPQNNRRNGFCAYKEITALLVKGRITQWIVYFLQCRVFIFTQSDGWTCMLSSFPELKKSGGEWQIDPVVKFYDYLLGYWGYWVKCCDSVHLCLHNQWHQITLMTNLMSLSAKKPCLQGHPPSLIFPLKYDSERKVLSRDLAGDPSQVNKQSSRAATGGFQPT